MSTSTTMTIPVIKHKLKDNKCWNGDEWIEPNTLNELSNCKVDPTQFNNALRFIPQSEHANCYRAMVMVKIKFIH